MYFVLTSYTLIMFFKVLSHFIMKIKNFIKYFKEKALKCSNISMKFLNISKWNISSCIPNSYWWQGVMDPVWRSFSRISRDKICCKDYQMTSHELTPTLLQALIKCLVCPVASMSEVSFYREMHVYLIEYSSTRQVRKFRNFITSSKYWPIFKTSFTKNLAVLLYLYTEVIVKDTSTPQRLSQGGVATHF